MKEISLTQGKVALVDDDKYDGLMQWKWYASKDRSGNFYAARSSSEETGKQITISMARQILGLKHGDERHSDHQNHNTLDNRQDNLRICTHQQNQRNRKLFLNSSSRFKGVSWYNPLKQWVARIKINGKCIHLGYWDIEEVAALAYDMVAIREHGEFAYLNFN